MTRFRLSGLDPARFTALFELDSAALAARHAVRCVADADTGYPCRVSLQDARAGEALLLLPYAHQPADSPYQASGPIYVRHAARAARLPPDHVPPSVATRLISLRAYDAAHRMVAAEVRDGPDVADWLQRCLDDAVVAYVHLHNARQGCYSCRADRAT